MLIHMLFVAAAMPAALPNQVPVDKFSNALIVQSPKLYNDYALHSKLIGLAQQLNAVMGLDARAVRDGLYTLQGVDISKTQQALSVQGAPLPGVQIEDKTKIFGESGEQIGELMKKSTSSERSAPTTSATAAPASLQSSSVLGIDAIQRLVQVTNLTYEAANLQALLQRATNDIINLSDGNIRTTIALGFPISINDPPPGYAAEVVITATGTGQKTPIRVVSMMPSERTYNYSRLTADSRQVNLGAVFSLLGIGFGSGSTKENLYLVQDTDTIAQLHHSADNAAVFGWQFRPVLRKPAIDPGIRNLFVVLSLDNVNQDICFTSHVSWIPYDRDKKVLKRNKASSRVPVSTNNSCPNALTSLSECGAPTHRLNPIHISGTALVPGMSSASIVRNEDGSFVVDIRTFNFYDGIELQIGPRRLRTFDYESTGNSKVSLAATGRELLDYDVSAVSMFGDPERLHTGTKWKRPDLVVNETPALCEITLSVAGIGGATVLLGVGNVVYVGTARNDTQVFWVPTKLLMDNAIVRAAIPFDSREPHPTPAAPKNPPDSPTTDSDLPARWSWEIGPDQLSFDVDSVTLVEAPDKDRFARYLLTGRGLGTDISVQKVRQPFVASNGKEVSDSLDLQIETFAQTGLAMVIVVPPDIVKDGVVSATKGSLTRIIRLAPQKKLPKFPKDLSVGVGAQVIEVAGENLQGVQRICFDSGFTTSAVPFVSADGTRLIATLPPKLTEKPGRAYIFVETSDGNRREVVLNIVQF